MAVSETILLILFFPIPALVEFLYGTEGRAQDVQELKRKDKCKKSAGEDISDERRKRRRTALQN